ncbi:GSK3-beta interaction protein [Chelonus insularis]|uniref:GSK3-beta interaction protein n=1 Tax=Chelonus insularis TaxID=460826 RepID=UPI00158B07E1|nr:GSK3-beta interaction protein [Chelonus insularis]
MLENEEEKVLDQDQWKVEAQAIINDVRRHVQDIKISEKLCSTNNSIYLNLTTLEGLKFCVEVSGNGFSITGNQHDSVINTDNKTFETPYSLLDSISPKYRESFGNDLMKKLNNLNDN